MSPVKATGITFHTLVGVGSERPVSHGNCFAVMCEDGVERRVVNFYLENLEELIKAGLTWPVEILPLSDRIAVMHDARIGERWYGDHYCEVCCPENLLPQSQRLRHERDVIRGIRKEGKGFITYEIGKEGAKFP